MRLNVPGHGYYCPVQPNGLYISTENVNPSAYFPGTTWSLYAQDRFLLGAGSSYAGGATGGEAYHALTVGEMPRHTHSPDNANGKKLNMSVSGSYRADDGTVAYTEGAWSNWIQNLIYETGGDKPHNNVPPYLAAYVWKCTGGAKYAL